MQTFRFRLERVLRWQLRKCALAEDRVRIAVNAISGTEEKLAALKALSEATEKECASLSNIGAADLWALARFREKNSNTAQALATEKQARWKVLLQERKGLQAERLRLKALGRIRDRDLEDHARSADKAIEVMAADSYFSRRAQTGGRARTVAPVRPRPG